jgi:hypothetical protein
MDTNMTTRAKSHRNRLMTPGPELKSAKYNHSLPNFALAEEQ